MSKSTLSYWLKDYPLSEDRIKELKLKGMKTSDAGYERFRNSMTEKRRKEELEVYREQSKRIAGVRDNSLFLSGLTLYLAEGSKTNRNRIVFTNTDVRIIRFFIWWIERFFSVSRERLRVQLHLYEDMDISREKLYWINELKIPEEQFYKEQIRRLQKSSFVYRESFRHGTCGIWLCDTKIKTEISMGIKALFEKIAEKY